MTSDVGIELLKPKYVKSMLVPADTAYWEVLYDDGTVLSEAQGAVYTQIDRSRLGSFQIIHDGTVVFEIHPRHGKTLHHLIYRRRSTLIGGASVERSRTVVFIIGLAPKGPFFIIDLENNEYSEDNSVISTLKHMPGEAEDLLSHWTTKGNALIA